eukprot:GHVT01101429.1.p1 GENE.GHVT01101429.1~~GHVT01101429.1.p1  ORF type:complete len:232 (-),score=30.67 GHVT01101429.1:534-1229(-)
MPSWTGRWIGSIISATTTSRFGGVQLGSGSFPELSVDLVGLLSPLQLCARFFKLERAVGVARRNGRRRWETWPGGNAPLGHIQHVDDQTAAVEVPQNATTLPLVLVCALFERGQVDERNLQVVAVLDVCQVRPRRGKFLVANSSVEARQGRRQRRLAGTGQANKRHVVLANAHTQGKTNPRLTHTALIDTGIKIFMPPCRTRKTLLKNSRGEGVVPLVLLFLVAIILVLGS